MYLWHIPFISSTWICCCISVGIPFVSTTRIYSRIFDTLFISTTGFADASLTHFIISSTRIRSTTGFADVILTHFVHIFNLDLLLYFCRYSIHIHNPELLMHFCRFATNNYNPDSMYIPDINFFISSSPELLKHKKKLLSQACQNYTISSINKFSLFYTTTRLSNLPQTVVVILSNLIVPSAAKDTYTVKSYANFFYCRQPLYIGKSYSVIYSRQFLVQLSSLTQLSVAYSSLKLSSHTWLSITDSPC